MTKHYDYEDILNKDWILSKWSSDINQMATYEVKVTGIVDGPSGDDWVVGNGWGLEEFTMPLEHFRKQAVPMGGKEACKAFMDELVA